MVLVCFCAFKSRTKKISKKISKKKIIEIETRKKISEVFGGSA